MMLIMILVIIPLNDKRGNRAIMTAIICHGNHSCRDTQVIHDTRGTHATPTKHGNQIGHDSRGIIIYRTHMRMMIAMIVMIVRKS
eukprot:5529271-Lingulodinium_polyedra.AAC.1